MTPRARADWLRREIERHNRLYYNEAAPEADAAEILEQFQTYRRTQDRALHQKLVLRYLPLVHRIARRYVRPGAPLEDLVQIGSIGLIHAVTTFDPTRGVKFETYAFHHVAGEIRHFLRDGLEAVRAPRWVRKIYADLTAARLFTICASAEVRSGESLSDSARKSCIPCAAANSLKAMSMS